MVRLETKISYSALYPTNFEKQKISLVLKIINEKTVAALKDKQETKVFVENVTKMWNILNVKASHVGDILKDDDRMPQDQQLDFLLEIAHCFNGLKSSYTHRVRKLTSDTREALYLTINGIVIMSRMFLNENNFSYVLLGHFQSDIIEGEFGVFRQSSGGNYYISYEQVLSSLTLRRLKLFDHLNLPYSNEHKKDSCCLRDLNDDEIELLDSCFEITDKTFTEKERSSLHYISGYVAKKLNIGLAAPSDHVDPNTSEFTENVSRGYLSHPSDELYNLAVSLYLYYRDVHDKTCNTRLLQAFNQIYECTLGDFENPAELLRRFVN